MYFQRQTLAGKKIASHTRSSPSEKPVCVLPQIILYRSQRLQTSTYVEIQPTLPYRSEENIFNRQEVIAS